ncbi:hypothetical protein F511_35117 [Dorcoceras hygrometricum]|uniref:Uncharacterized protein n=1 Tax=Dorcoceras hygrometricum TaxID=472368 RepID=A0A2Z7CSE7_9LAMI|nr:hypothetical protein F511_35117 [Dorcoceras hygrometricum]
MQHAINQFNECMRAIKDWIARPVSQLAIKSVEPLHHAQQVSRWKSSVRDIQGPSAHHSSIRTGHGRNSRPAKQISPGFVNARQKDSTQVLPSYAGTNNKSKAQNNEECSPTSSKELKQNLLNEASNSRTRRNFTLPLQR